MQKVPFTTELKKQHRKIYNPEKILQEIEREIEEKGFSIFEVDEQKRLEFFYHFSKKSILPPTNDSSFMLIRFVGTVIMYLIATIFVGGTLEFWDFFSQETQNTIIYSVITVIGLFLLLYFNKYIRFTLNKQQIQNFSGIKDKHIFITKRYIFVNNTFQEVNETSLKKGGKIYNLLFSLGKYYYEPETSEEASNILKTIHFISPKNRKTNKLHNSFILLEKYFNYTKARQEQITNEIKSIKSGSFNFSNINYYINELHKTIEEITHQQKVSFTTIKKLHFNEKIDFSKFETYLKNKLIFSLKSMKYIVSNHLFVIDYQNNSTKNLDSEHIQLANARLKTYKTQLEQQVEILEQQVEILEQQIEKLERKK